MTKDNKVILVVRRFQVGSMKADYRVEKSATSLDEASRYQVSLENLNDDKENTSYHLFNGFGVMYEVKEPSEDKDDRISV
jgi:hypothetical protein